MCFTAHTTNLFRFVEKERQPTYDFAAPMCICWLLSPSRPLSLARASLIGPAAPWPCLSATSCHRAEEIKCLKMWLLFLALVSWKLHPSNVSAISLFVDLSMSIILSQNKQSSVKLLWLWRCLYVSLSILPIWIRVWQIFYPLIHGRRWSHVLWFICVLLRMGKADDRHRTSIILTEKRCRMRSSFMADKHILTDKVILRGWSQSERNYPCAVFHTIEIVPKWIP